MLRVEKGASCSCSRCWAQPECPRRGKPLQHFGRLRDRCARSTRGDTASGPAWLSGNDEVQTVQRAYAMVPQSAAMARVDPESATDLASEVKNTEPVLAVSSFLREDPDGSCGGSCDDPENWADAHARHFVMPPHPMVGIAADVTGLSINELTNAPEVYNVELSWLAFNWRVLTMAMMPEVKLLERLNFVGITSCNLDGFFAKRVGALMKQRAAGLSNMKKPLPKTPQQQLEAISHEVKRMVKWMNWTLNTRLLPQLQEEGIHILDYSRLSRAGIEHLQRYYLAQVDKLLTPIKLDPAHPFPCLPSGSLNIAVVLHDPAEVEPSGICAIVNIPTLLDRWHSVPPEFANDDTAAWQHGFMPLEQIIIANLGQLFGGMTIESAHTFRVTRNAELDRHEEDADDLLDMISVELRDRRFAPFVRLEVDLLMPFDLTEFLALELDLDVGKDVYRVNGLLGQAALSDIPKLLEPERRAALMYPTWSPTVHPRLASPYRQRNYSRMTQWSGTKWKSIRSIFNIIRDSDILLHHPYQSFASSTQRFVEEAARDPGVVAIKCTLYRTSSDSPIIAALLRAAENGKQVAVLVELKARFDEARNVGFAQRLEDAGCNVAYGLVGLKTHAKCTLVVRREKAAPGGLRTYVHISTGNYNPSTAGVYADLGLLTCDEELGQDVVDLFKFLTGLHSQAASGGYRRLLVAPKYLQRQFVELIDREIDNARRGLPAAICIKLNGLDDKHMCFKLYEAAAAGVRVDCIVRGLCRLRPGIPGVSNNIRVVSVIGRFLEHHRVFCFFNAGEPVYYIGSADWMKRNLQKRVEVAAPITRERSKQRLRELLGLSLLDKRAWEMLPDGLYERPATRTAEGPLSAPLLNQPGFDTQQLQWLDEKGLQGCLMCSIVAKIKAYNQTGVVF